jgi:ABC-type xylose transport system permease subunit
MRPYNGSLVFFSGSLFFLYESRNIRDFGFDVLGAKFMPQFVLIVIAALALLDMTAIYLRSRKNVSVSEGSDPEFETTANRKSIITFVLLSIYIAVIASDRVSFGIVTPIFIISVAWFLGRPTPKALAIISVFAIVFSLVVGMVFRIFLYVDLP